MRALVLALALAACGDNLMPPEPALDACGATTTDAAPDVDARDCRMPPCGEPDAAWTEWAERCFAPGECRLIHCPLQGDDLVHVCRP